MNIRFLLCGFLLVTLTACAKAPPVENPPTRTGTGARLTYPEVLVKALNGDHRAEFELGAMFHDGDGVERDYDKALEWYKKSSEGGNRQAAFNIGMMYKNGDGVSVNLATARGWFIRASDAGDVRAAFQLGQMSYTGEGAEQDFAKAFQYFMKAAMGGLADAQLNVGVMEMRVEGVDHQDVVEAYAWLKLASEGGSDKAATLLTTLTGKISEDQRRQGEARAAKLKAEIKKLAGPNVAK